MYRQGGRFRTSKRRSRKARRATAIACNRRAKPGEAAGLHRPESESRRDNKAAFARRKRRKDAGGNAKWCISPGPPLVPNAWESGCIRGGSAAQDCFYFRMNAEAIPRRIAARVPLEGDGAAARGKSSGRKWFCGIAGGSATQNRRICPFEALVQPRGGSGGRRKRISGLCKVHDGQCRVAALAAQDCFDFPLKRKQSIAESPHRFSLGQWCSRRSVEDAQKDSSVAAAMNRKSVQKTSRYLFQVSARSLFIYPSLIQASHTSG